MLGVVAAGDVRTGELMDQALRPTIGVDGSDFGVLILSTKEPPSASSQPRLSAFGVAGADDASSAGDDGDAIMTDISAFRGSIDAPRCEIF